MERHYEGLVAYRRSKFALTALGFQQAKADRWTSAGVLVNSIHPGTLLNTKVVRDAGLLKDNSGSPDEGARAILDVMASTRASSTTGAFFNESREGRANEQTYDTTVQQRLQTLVEGWLKPFTPS